jgi:hypothetical protein
MANQIKDALESAVEKDNESPELSARVKKLLARKKNLKRRTHNPKRIFRDK